MLTAHSRTRRMVHGSGTDDSFKYCGNGATTASLHYCHAERVEAIDSKRLPCTTCTYTASTALTLRSAPGLLDGATDAAGYPLSVDSSTMTPAGSLPSVR